jgi:hypothetical protein
MFDLADLRHNGRRPARVTLAEALTLSLANLNKDLELGGAPAAVSRGVL